MHKTNLPTSDKIADSPSVLWHFQETKYKFLIILEKGENEKTIARRNNNNIEGTS